MVWDVYSCVETVMCDFFFPFDFEENLKLIYKEYIFAKTLKNCHLFFLEPRLAGICDPPSLSAEIKGVHNHAQ